MIPSPRAKKKEKRKDVFTCVDVGGNASSCKRVKKMVFFDIDFHFMIHLCEPEAMTKEKTNFRHLHYSTIYTFMKKILSYIHHH